MRVVSNGCIRLQPKTFDVDRRKKLLAKNGRPIAYSPVGDCLRRFSTSTRRRRARDFSALLSSRASQAALLFVICSFASVDSAVAAPRRAAPQLSAASDAGVVPPVTWGDHDAIRAKGSRIASWIFVGKAGAAAVPLLVEAARYGTPDLREQACLELASLEDDALPSLPAMAEMLRYEDDDYGLCAATVLGHLGAAAVPSLIATLQDPLPRVRWRAALTLKMIGSEAEIALPDLKALDSDADSDVKVIAHDAIARIEAREGNQFRPAAKPTRSN